MTRVSEFLKLSDEALVDDLIAQWIRQLASTPGRTGKDVFLALTVLMPHLVSDDGDLAELIKALRVGVAGDRARCGRIYREYLERTRMMFTVFGELERSNA